MRMFSKVILSSICVLTAGYAFAASGGLWSELECDPKKCDSELVQLIEAAKANGNLGKIAVDVLGLLKRDDERYGDADRVREFLNQKGGLVSTVIFEENVETIIFVFRGSLINVLQIASLPEVTSLELSRDVSIMLERAIEAQ
jgi:hypothetical protein